MDYEIRYNFRIVGDTSVGKTSLLMQYAQNKFDNRTLSTIGIDNYTKDIVYKKKKIRIKIWDSAGQERMRSLTESFFKNSDAIIVVFDLSSMDSFVNLKTWTNSLKFHLGEQNHIKIIIVGNKIDLEREIEKVMVEKFVADHGFKYMETSAKLNLNIEECFNYLIDELLKRDNNRNEDDDVFRGSFPLNRKTHSIQKSRKRCCS